MKFYNQGLQDCQSQSKVPTDGDLKWIIVEEARSNNLRENYYFICNYLMNYKKSGEL